MESIDSLHLEEDHLLFLLLVLNIKKKYRSKIESFEDIVLQINSSLENVESKNEELLANILAFENELTLTQQEIQQINGPSQNVIQLQKMNASLIEILEQAEEEIYRLRAKSN